VNITTPMPMPLIVEKNFSIFSRN